MKIDTDVPMIRKVQAKYPFDDMMPGDSLHFRLEVLRKRALVAFRGWVIRTGNHHLVAVSRRVGDDDPKGPGWRMWVQDRDVLKRQQEEADAEFRKNWDI